MTTDTLALAALAAAAGLLLHWLPRWRRQGLWFGVTVPVGFAETPVGRRALHRYRIALWTLTGLAVAGIAAARPIGRVWLVPAALLLQVLGASAAFAVVRRDVLAHAGPAPATRSAVLMATHEGLPGGPASVLVPLGLIAATAAYLRAMWLELPARIPVHWTLDGTADRWVDRTPLHVYGQLVVLAALAAFQLVLAELIIHRSPRGRVAGTEEWTTRFRRANLVLLVAGTWGVTAMICALSLLPLIAPGSAVTRLVWIVPLAFVATLVPFLWQVIRLTRDRASGSDGTPDACWKFGLIYVNRDDAAIFVEKRFGVGYTLNFGHPGLVWILVAGVLVVLVAHLVS